MLRRLNLGTHILFIALFSLFTIAQYNDPDGLLWMAGYSFCSLLAIFSLYRIDVVFWSGFAAAVYLALSFAHMPPLDAAWYPLESGRESMGMAICAGFCLLLIFLNRSYRHHPI